MPILYLRLKLFWGISSPRHIPTSRACVRMAATIWSPTMGKSVVPRLSGVFHYGVAIRYFAGQAIWYGCGVSIREQPPICAGGWSIAQMLKDGLFTPVRGRVKRKNWRHAKWLLTLAIAAWHPSLTRDNGLAVSPQTLPYQAAQGSPAFGYRLSFPARPLPSGTTQAA